MKRQARGKGGRPPKFREPRRPVTVTLPERTLRLLAGIHEDRARAIVAAADLHAERSGAVAPVEVVETAPGVGLILVAANPLLESIEGLRMVQVAPGRNLLAVPLGTSVDSLEVALADLVEHPPRSARPGHRAAVEELLRIVRRSRRERQVTRSEILLVRSGP